MEKTFITGSTAFFDKIEGFVSKDIDIIYLDKLSRIGMCKLISYPTHCSFQYADLPKEKIIKYVLKHNIVGASVGFLVPDYAKHLNLTIDDIKTVYPLLEQLDEKHYYAKIIADAYVENNDFTLTEDQLLAAYNSYLTSRGKDPIDKIIYKTEEDD